MGILGSITKGIFGGKKKTTSANSKGTVQPYAPTIPYINDFLSNTQQVFRNAPQISTLEQGGYDLLNDTARNPSTYFDTGGGELTKTARGDYLTPDTNPYLADIAKRIGGVAGAGVNATFGGRGRSSGGLAGYYGGKGIADATGEVLSNAYESERGRQIAAAGQAPQFEAARYLGPQAMISAGQNVSARPFDIAQNYGGILANIAGLGQQTTGAQQNYKQSGGLIGKIANSFTNKLFPS